MSTEDVPVETPPEETIQAAFAEMDRILERLKELKKQMTFDRVLEELGRIEHPE